MHALQISRRSRSRVWWPKSFDILASSETHNALFTTALEKPGARALGADARKKTGAMIKPPAAATKILHAIARSSRHGRIIHRSVHLVRQHACLLGIVRFFGRLFEGRCPSITPCAVHNLVRKNNVTHLRTVVRVITRIHVVECHEKCTRRLHTG
jgi:hypothetical protein